MEIPKVHNRLKRIEGQVRGVEEMVALLRSTDDIIIQLSAIRSAVDSLIISIIEDEIDLADQNRLLELKRTVKRMIKG